MKKSVLLTFLFALIICSRTFGQFPTMWDASYQHTSSQNFSNEGRFMVRDANGDIFVLADATSDLDLSGNTGSSTFHYVVLLKYDSSGTLLADRVIDVKDHYGAGFTEKSAFGLDLDAAGNVYIGYSYFEQTNDFDIRIEKYNPANLALNWQFIYKPGTRDIGIDMAVTPTGTVAAIVNSITGTNTTAHLLLASGNQVSTSSQYAFITDEEFPTSIIFDSSNNIYTTGYKEVSLFKNIYTCSFTLAGANRWSIVYNGGSNIRDDFGTDLTIEGSDLYVTGTTDRGAPDFNDAFIMKHVASTGKVRWINFLDHNNSMDDGIRVNASQPGYIYVACESTADVFVSRIDENNGSEIGRGIYHPNPVTPYNSIDNLSVSDFKISAGNSFYITGNVEATETSGSPFSGTYLVRFDLVPAARGNMAFRITSVQPVDGSFNESYSSVCIVLDQPREDILWLKDAFISFASHSRESVKILDLEGPNPFRLQSGVGTNQTSVTVYPNPAYDKIHLSTIENVEMLRFYDLSGKLIKEIREVRITGNTINIQDIPNGLYVLELTHSDTSTSHHRLSIF